MTVCDLHGAARSGDEHLVRVMASRQHLRSLWIHHSRARGGHSSGDPSLCLMPWTWIRLVETSHLNVPEPVGCGNSKMVHTPLSSKHVFAIILDLTLHFRGRTTTSARPGKTRR
eukprot:884788-Rhodomonas_salina.1